MVELSNPGLIFPGVIGAISLLMAFFSLGMLPINYAGILLILLAFGFFVAEVFTASFGLFTAGGIAALVLGSMVMFRGGPLFQVNPWLVGSTAVVIAVVFVFVISRVIGALHRQPTTGWEDLIGKPALVKAALTPEGMVLFKGERWKAVAEEGRLEPGETVVIDKVENLKLYVSKK
jgi:membrane-bound serine protease (ClpP class)